jgi:hypothetical protein
LCRAAEGHEVRGVADVDPECGVPRKLLRLRRGRDAGRLALEEVQRSKSFKYALRRQK